MLNKQELVNIVRKIRTLNNESATYITSIPSDICAAFFDNTYVNNLQTQKELLITSLFGDMAEDVCWFLYEFTPGSSAGPHCITPDGTEYVYRTDEDYYDYLIKTLP